MTEQTFETTIPFQGFYGSMHEGCIGSTVEMEIDHYLGEDGGNKTQDQVNEWQESINYCSIFEAYSKHYVDFVNSELGLASLTYKELVSPKEYNFTTDRIFCTVGYADIRRLYALYRHSDSFRELIKDQFTSYDGFASFYSNDVADWIEKPFDTWDHNEIGMLIQCHWNESDIKEDDSLDYNMRPMYETVMNELPGMPEGAG